MKISLLLAFASALILSSCSLSVNLKFNKEMGGDYAMKVDMSSLMAMGGDSAAPAIKEEDFDKMKAALAATQGISDVKSQYDSKGVLEISYKFNNLSALNTAMTQNDSEEAGTPGLMKLSMKGTKLLIDMTPDEALSKDQSTMEGMGEMFTINYSMAFDRPVKKVKSTVATYDKATNTISCSLTLKDFLDKRKKWKTEVSFQ
jgi:hypothetical protein